MTGSDVTLVGVGDISLISEQDCDAQLELAAPLLRQGDIVFGQNEQVYSDRPTHAYHWNVVQGHGDKLATALRNAGFTVLSNAGNHHMNAGPEALVDTIECLRRNGIAPVGVGMNIAEARQPVIVERKGIRVAFLGYSSVIPRAELPWEARENKPGCVPMFINTFYDQIDFHPGTPPRIVTFAEKANLVAMQDDVRRAKRDADVVVISMHWGIHHIPVVIAMYEYEVGHAAIDAGADLILGTGPHILKGIEVYKGKVIFHCLGNFSKMKDPHPTPGVRGYWEDLRPPHIQLRESFGWRACPVCGFGPRQPAAGVIASSSADYAGWDETARSMPPEIRWKIAANEEMFGLIARCTISDGRVARVSYQPMIMVTKSRRPEPLVARDARSNEIERYVEWVTREAGMDTRYAREGDEVVVLT